MLLAAKALMILVAALHVYFLILEMFLWAKPLGLKVFKHSQEAADSSATLAANQGLYNGFLAAGLIWGLVQSDPAFSIQLSVFFLACVIIAGLYGGYSVNKRIFFIQSVPAVVSLALLLAGH